MKNSLPIITIILICVLSSCTKNALLTDTNISFPQKDSLPFPLTVGTWWKYQRLDTSWIETGGPQRSYFIFDSSYEMITVTGKTKLSDSVQAAILQVKNLTSGKTDTSYAFYYRSNFIVSQIKLTDLSPYAKDYFIGAYDMRFRLPLTDGLYSFLPYATTVYIKKDTLITVLNKQFLHTVFTHEFFPNYIGSLVFYIFLGSDSFLGNNIGFLYWRASHDYGRVAYGKSTKHWFVRRIMDYYIAP